MTTNETAAPETFTEDGRTYSRTAEGLATMWRDRRKAELLAAVALLESLDAEDRRAVEKLRKTAPERRDAGANEILADYRERLAASFRVSRPFEAR